MILNELLGGKLIWLNIKGTCANSFDETKKDKSEAVIKQKKEISVDNAVNVEGLSCGFEVKFKKS